jgi:hypothetical protein
MICNIYGCAEATTFRLGGLHRGLLRSSQEATVIRAFDWDQNARCVYAANYDCPIEKVMLNCGSYS